MMLKEICYPLWFGLRFGLPLCLPLWVQPAIATSLLGTDLPTPTASFCPAQLESAIEAIIDQDKFQRARWGILIQTLDTQETLYARAAEQYFIPASNVKLLTTAAALTELGPEFQTRTSVYAIDDQPDAAVLEVVGRGDPSLSDADLQQLASQIRDRGITQIAELQANDRYFPGDPVNSNWEWEDIQAGYGAPVNSLILNGNAIGFTLFPQAVGEPLRVVWDDPADRLQWRVENQAITVPPTEPEFLQVGRDFSQPILRVGGQLRAGASPASTAIAVPNPTQVFLRRLQRVLTALPIPVRQVAIAPNSLPSPETVEIAAIDSPPLAELVVIANRDSDNLYAEAILRLLGQAIAPDLNLEAANLDALEAGLAAVETVLTPLGVNPDSYRLADGSGLSRHNLVSPEALVQTLREMGRSPYASLYRQSLAVAGVSGTLRNRFVDTAIAGRLQGKTGALSGNTALSGYVQPPAYEPLVFSILVNQAVQPSRELRQAIDEIILQLAELQPCADSSHLNELRLN